MLLLLTLVFQTSVPAFAALETGVTTLSAVCAGDDGRNYRVSASYGEDAAIPGDAALSVTAIPQDDAAFDGYASQAEAALGDAVSIHKIQLFDISIVSSSEISPAVANALNSSFSRWVLLRKLSKSAWSL